MKKIGIYIHVPFCKSKCPYCDFYSLRCEEGKTAEYLSALKKEIGSFENVVADTIYIGGGTPSVLTGDSILEIINLTKKQFGFSSGEITVEANPSSLTEDFAKKAVDSGVNRISLGVQSAVDDERKVLGRRCACDEISEKIKLIKSFGIGNISLDVMLGVPNQTISSLKNTLEFCVDSDVPHISAYILKIENGTFFDRHRNRFAFPDEELTAEMYEYTCEYLNQNGFSHYEISNFAKPGFESQHNLKYWNCEEYLGFGPSSHSFFCGKRFFHDNSLEKYIADPTATVNDGDGGSFEEYAMLKLRLSKGLLEDEVSETFGFSIPESIRRNALPFANRSLLISDENGIRLTSSGFLISNYIISRLL